MRKRLCVWAGTALLAVLAPVHLQAEPATSGSLQILGGLVQPSPSPYFLLHHLPGGAIAHHEVAFESHLPPGSIVVRTGERRVFSAPLFVDCTGHGWIGYYAGAEYRMGQEARDEYHEALAPIEPGARTQGNTLYQAFIVTRDEPVAFECPEWACQWRQDADFEPRGGHRRISEIRRPGNYDVPSHGKGRNPGDDVDGTVVRRWWVEYGGMLNTIEDAEKIRDELLRVNLGLWNYAKNHNPKTKAANARRELVWLNYVPGVRESRRLLGPHVMSQAAYDKQIVHEDTVAFTDWGPDVHHPEGFWVKGNDCIHVYQGRRTSIPYRSLYSRNVSNLLMAGRCHSATHIALARSALVDSEDLFRISTTIMQFFGAFEIHVLQADL